MFELVSRSHALELRVFYDEIRDECPMQCQVDIFIEGARDKKTTVLTVIRGQVSATAAERNA